MDPTSRRQFLRSVATTAGATAALTTFPPAIQRALAIPAATGTRTIEAHRRCRCLTNWPPPRASCPTAPGSARRR